MKMNIYNRSIHEHSRCLLMSDSSLFIIIIFLLPYCNTAEYTVCPQYKNQSQGQVKSEITDDNGDYSTSQVYQKSSGSKQLILILQRFFSMVFLKVLFSFYIYSQFWSIVVKQESIWCRRLFL